ncbi:MAG TPA: nitronate monooxygenase [Solirubrobacteraceae bacterium]
MSESFPRLLHPIIQAPMAGGPSTPQLAAAVSAAGGLGFLAAGYRTPTDLAADLTAARDITQAPVGVNLFLLAETAVDETGLAAYASAIEPDARRHGVALGQPSFDDDSFDAKVELLCRERPAVVSFTFGCPTAGLVARLHELEIAVWVTVTEVDEARIAVQASADALVVQGAEAGGHRGTFEDTDGRGEISLLPLLRLVARDCELPLIASGGIADGAGVAAVLAAGAHAAQLGTAFMRCPEAGTSDPHRIALQTATPTALTRAFSGRRARGIVNAFMTAHDDHAPAAYPHVNQLTAPMRAAARQAGDATVLNLWAGQAHGLAEARPAAELVRRFSDDARAALEHARLAFADRQ